MEEFTYYIYKGEKLYRLLNNRVDKAYLFTEVKKDYYEFKTREWVKKGISRLWKKEIENFQIAPNYKIELMVEWGSFENGWITLRHYYNGWEGGGSEFHFDSDSIDLDLWDDDGAYTDDYTCNREIVTLKKQEKEKLSKLISFDELISWRDRNCSTDDLFEAYKEYFSKHGIKYEIKKELICNEKIISL